MTYEPRVIARLNGMQVPETHKKKKYFFLILDKDIKYI